MLVLSGIERSITRHFCCICIVLPLDAGFGHRPICPPCPPIFPRTMYHSGISDVNCERLSWSQCSGDGESFGVYVIVLTSTLISFTFEQSYGVG